MADEVTQATDVEEKAVSTPTDSLASPPDTETVEFDASTFEVDHGLPEGTLEGVTDGKAAVEKLREYTDKILSAGLMSSAQLSQADVSQKTQTGDTKDAATKAEGKADGKAEPTDFEKFRSEIMQSVKAELRAAQEQAQRAQDAEMLRQIDSRIVAEIDSWNSPKYGSKDKRGYKELKAVRELRELAQTQYAGYVSQGKNSPPIETLMRQVRAFHDSDYTPSKKQATAAEKKPLGTPGTRSAGVDDGQPRTIHHAVFGK